MPKASNTRSVPDCPPSFSCCCCRALRRVRGLPSRLPEAPPRFATRLLPQCLLVTLGFLRRRPRFMILSRPLDRFDPSCLLALDSCQLDLTSDSGDFCLASGLGLAGGAL